MTSLKNAYLLIFCFLLSVGSFAQSDTACVSKRWIAVKNNEHNAIIFDPTASVFNEIKKLAEANLIHLNTSEFNGYNQTKWYPITLVKKDSNFVDYSDYLALDSSVFSIRIQSDIPYVDEYGDPLVRTNPDGTKSFVYDEPEVYYIQIEDIQEVRIREERNFNGETGLFEGDFIPTGISFFIKNNFEMRELFWVDLTIFLEKVSKPELFPWHSFLKNKEYSGFQYMQVSCYDDLIRY